MSGDVDPADPVARPIAWMVIAFGIPAQATTDEPTAIRWRKAGGDVRPLYEVPPPIDTRMEPPLLTALRHAWHGKHAAAEAYAMLAATRLDGIGEHLQARCLRETVEVLTGKREPVYVYPAKITPPRSTHE